MLGQPKASFYNIRLQRNYREFQHTQQNIPSEVSPIILPVVGILLNKLRFFFWTKHPQIFTRTNGLQQVLEKPSHIIIIWCITAACLRIFVLQSRFASAVFPGAKFKITDEAIFQNAIFPKAIFL